MSVALSCRTGAGSPWRTHLRKRACQVLAALRLGRYELSLSIVDDEEMRTLNRSYRGLDRPTDVLAFPLGEQRERSRPRRRETPARRSAVVGMGRRTEFADLLLGDVVISIETAAAQARAMRRTLAERLDVLLIHGVLHLVGYDHEVSAAERRRMARRTREVRAALTALPRLRGRRSCPRRSANRVSGSCA